METLVFTMENFFEKCIAASCLFFWSLAPASAQECNHPLGLIKNTEFVYQVTEKGKKDGTLNNKVMQQALNAEGAFVTTIKRTRVTEKKRPQSAEEFRMRCVGDTVYLDALLLIQEQALRAFDGKNLEFVSVDVAYPHHMQVGHALPDARLEVKVNSQSASISNLHMAAVNRKVEDRQTVTTPAGTFDCFKVTYQYVVRLDALGIDTENIFNVEEYYSTEHGIIKVQFTTLKGKKSKGMELLSKKSRI